MTRALALQLPLSSRQEPTSKACLAARTKTALLWLCPSFLLLRQDAAQTGPLWRGEHAEEKSEGWRAGCAPVRCAHRDVRSANPVACSRTRSTGMCGGHATRGVLS